MGLIVANAAHELASLFTEWNSNLQKALYIRRGLPEGARSADYDFWQKQRRCVELLVETEESLEILRERGIGTDIYRPLLTRIWAFTFSPDVGWQGANGGHVVSIEDIHLLQTLSLLLSALGETEPRMTLDGRVALLELLDEIVIEIHDCFDLPQEIRTRLASHIQFLRDALDPETDVAPRKLRRLLDQMAGVILSAMFETTDPERKRKLFVWSMSRASAMSQNAAYDGVKSIAASSVKNLLGIDSSE